MPLRLIFMGTPEFSVPTLTALHAAGHEIAAVYTQPPRLGAYNGHASLLPRWRGAAPIQRAISAGDRETGMMIMKMEAGLDTGPVALAERVAITPDMTGGELHDRLKEV